MQNGFLTFTGRACLLILTMVTSSAGLRAADAQQSTKPPALTAIRFYPAKDGAQKMLKGKFTGSNEGATTGFETIADIKELPREGEWNQITLPKPVRYRFIKYEAPANSWGSVAEIEFLSGTEKIQGVPFGTTGSRNNSGSDFTKALDGDVKTFFEGAEPNNQYVGIDLGASAQAAAPEFSPAPGNYPTPQAITITSSTPEAKIRFVRGMGTPSRTSGEEYRGPVKLEKGGILVAIAYSEELASSPVRVGAYRIGEAASGALVRTFHIGNSLTDTIDNWLKPVAESGGHKLDFHRFTIPGAPTDWLWAHPGSGFGDSRYTEAFFAFAPFDHLFTQPFSGHGRSVVNEAEHSGKFFTECRKSSPKVQLWLYQQWPEQKFGESWSKGTIPLGGTKSMWDKMTLLPDESIADGGWNGIIIRKKEAPRTWQQAVTNHSRYFEILRDEMQRQFQGNTIRIVPAGPALATLKNQMEAGKISGLGEFFGEIFADGVHLTPKGRYLVALVHYACIFKESPVGKISPLNSGLTESQAKAFQEIAWETVKAHPWAGVAKP